MVHLASVPNDKAADAPLVKGMEKLEVNSNDDGDGATASVYGSRFAAQSLPKHEMPEKEMPKEMAYRMIKDDLSLDGNPMLNLASFVTTYMVCRVYPDGTSLAATEGWSTDQRDDCRRRRKRSRSSWLRLYPRTSSITRSTLRRQRFRIAVSA